MACIFCEGIEEKQILLQTENYKVVLDIDPIQSGHVLIISKQHFMDVRELPDSALMDHFHIHIVPRYKGDDFWTHQKVNCYPMLISELVKQLQNERE